LRKLHITITPRLILRLCLYCFGILLCLNFLMLIARFGFGHDHVLGFASLFSFNVERNIPMAYTFLLFVLASSICMLAANIERKGTSRWAFLGIVFLILGIDEFVSIHERFSEPVRELLSTSGFFHYAWIIPYSVIVVVLFLILFGWLRNLPKYLRAGMLVSALTYLSGVFLMEGIGGWYSGGVPERKDLVYYLMVSLEESLEILGLTIFIYVVSKYLALSFEYLQIEFAEIQ